jgi:hypothetical protein
MFGVALLGFLWEPKKNGHDGDDLVTILQQIVAIRQVVVVVVVVWLGRVGLMAD